MKCLPIVICLVLFASTAFSGDLLNVPQDYPTIQSAINAATNGDIVIVAPDSIHGGPYYENIDFMGKSIVVMSEEGPESTTIDGQRSGSVVTFANGEGIGSILKGFTITNGDGVYQPPFYQGAGIWCSNASPTIEHNIITRNFDLEPSRTLQGGGIYCSGSSARIKHNIITQNEAEAGAGICVRDSTDLIINNNLIANNKGSDSGGGITIVDSVITINRTTVTKNTISHGSSSIAGGVFIYGNSSGLIKNSIFWNNTKEDLSVTLSTFPPSSVTYCNIDGGWPESPATNIDTDPLFVNPSLNGDFHLQQDPCQPGVNNPCVDAGDPGGNAIKTTRTDQKLDVNTTDLGFHYDAVIHVRDDFSSIQEGIDHARAYDTVLVEPGMHLGNIYFDGKPIIVKSIYNKSTLNGANYYRGVTFGAGHPDTVLDGFTIMDCAADWGAGIKCSGSPTIKNCIIKDCTATIGGGGIDAGGNPRIVNCLFLNNSAPYGGGIHIGNNFVEMINNTFYGNTGSGILLETVVKNKSASSTPPRISNSILWNNTPAQIDYLTVGVHLDVYNCDVQGGWPHSGSDNFDLDPLFMDPASEEFELSPNSPCIERGDNDRVPFWLDTDREGEARIFDGDNNGTAVVDVGFDEYFPWELYVPLHYPTIQEAVDAAKINATIYVSPNTYYENVKYNGKSIGIRSTDGADVTVIDGMQAGPVVDMTSPYWSELTGFLITNGSAENGAGVIAGAYSWIKENRIIDNHATEYGGGVYSKYGRNLLRDCVIENNSAGEGGGAVYLESLDELTFFQNKLIGNSSDKTGGAVFIQSCNDISISKSLFQQNSAAYSGGGIYATIGGTVDYYVHRNQFINNSADWDGGALAMLFWGSGGGKGNIESTGINNNYFRNNSSKKSGGAIFLFDDYGDQRNIVNNALIQNSAGDNGGAIAWEMYAEPRIINCTMTLNSAGVRGGAIDNGNENVGAEIYSCIIWDNSAPLSPEIGGTSHFFVYYNNIKGGWPGNNNIDTDPLFINALTGDIHLNQDPCQPGISNPCVDTGDPYWGMIDGTTRTDWLQDSNNVDMGYHYLIEDVIRVPDDYLSIQAAIIVANDWDTIFVEPGTYVENMDFMGKNIKVISRDGPEATLIDGNQQGSVVIFYDNEDFDAVLEGFTITNGFSTTHGGGIFCYNASPTICNNRIFGNISSLRGGGVACGKGSSAVIKNNFIYDNVANYGGGIHCYISDTSIINNTIYRNTGNGLGGGIELDQSSPQIKNCILWENTSPEGPQINISISGDPEVSYCVIQGGYAQGTHILNAVPRLMDPVNGDFHLTPVSPCINRGTNTVPVFKDFDNDARPHMGTVDIGADELSGTLNLEADRFTLSESEGGQVNFTLTAGPFYAGRKYILLASISGTIPGHPLPLGNSTLALNWDFITNTVLMFLNTPYFHNFYGFLDASGQATAQFNTAGPMDPGSVGIVNSFAYCLGWPWDFASNPVDILIVE